MKSILIFLILAFLLRPSHIIAQTTDQIERSIQVYSHLIDEHLSNPDSLRGLNYSLLAYLDVNLPKAWRELWFGYDSIGTRIHTALSPDHKLRVWSWDTGLRDSLN